MEISLTLFLALYGLAVIVFLILSFFLLFHAVRFGQVTLLNFISMLVYAAGSAAILISAARFIDAHDWAQTVNAAALARSIFF